jgi:hypothetical protein
MMAFTVDRSWPDKQIGSTSKVSPKELNAVYTFKGLTCSAGKFSASTSAIKLGHRGMRSASSSQARLRKRTYIPPIKDGTMTTYSCGRARMNIALIAVDKEVN